MLSFVLLRDAAQVDYGGQSAIRTLYGFYIDFVFGNVRQQASLRPVDRPHNIGGGATAAAVIATAQDFQITALGRTDSC